MSSSSPASSPWEPPLPEELQAMLPQYEILGILGRGGMGAVYKGRQAKLDRTVAIKVLPETFTQGEDKLNFAKRFEQEAKAMANLDHPAILSVYDFGETANGQLYFVMEFIDGMDIHQYLKLHGGRLPQEHALSICAHVLDALEYAHSQGIVHRDIKPANILLNREGRVKIADFGLAKRFGDHADADAPALTMSNVAVGTPDFVAPEALDSDQVPDHRADLYAVGVMLYQMLTGKLPRGNYQMPSELNPEVDPRLDEIVSTAMAANPDYRYASAGAVRADLDLVLSGPLAKVEAGEPSGAVEPVVPVTSSLRGKKAPAKSSTMPLILGLGAGALVIAGLVVILAGKRGEPESLPATLPEVIVEKSPELPVTAAAPAPAAPAEKTPEPVAKAEPPKAEPKSALAPAPPLAMAEKNAEVPADPLATLPGLQTRLNGYLTARRTKLTELATKYGRGLDSRLNQSADAGDLKLTAAYDEEKARVVALVSSLAAPVTDPRGSVSKVPALPELPGDAPETLVTLRETWTGESSKILATLEGALQQSLQALESELTKARDLEKAKAVMAYRESLANGSAGTPARIGAAAVLAPATTIEAGKSARAPLVTATKDAPFENSLGMKFVPVPGTDVLFCIHEVRYKDYAEYAKKAKEAINGGWKIQTHDSYAIKKDEENHPVTGVNRDDARAFCAWLSEKDGKNYRLPTDREWSLAVGIGDREDWKSDTTPENVFKVQEAFPWGAEWPPKNGAGNYSDLSRRERAPRENTLYLDSFDDGFPTTAPVMSFEPNKLGLFDLGGNVREWVDDWYSDKQERGILRGGSWGHSLPGELLSSRRDFGAADGRHYYHGFRVVLEIGTLSAPPAAGAPISPANRPVPLASNNRMTVADSTLSRATKDAPFENTLGMKFVPVNGTEVLFCIHEVRYKDYAAYDSEAQGVDASWKDQSTDDFTPTDRPEDHPVMKVNWNDATAFCEWLSRKEGKTYRLPTDREWSVAVGIGDQETWAADTTPATVFKVTDLTPWGTGWPPPAGAGNYSDESRQSKFRDGANYLEGYDDSFPTTAPVMSFEANNLGLFDLGGNVWEWCEDFYSVEQNSRVLRGGSWNDAVRGYILSSNRGSYNPVPRFNRYGFRIVLVASAAAPSSVALPVSRPAPPLTATDPSLARATKDAPFENSLGMKFVPVPGTDVLFCIHETRRQDYAAFDAETPDLDGTWKNRKWDGLPCGHEDFGPVAFVNWTDAQAFCVWLSTKEKKNYRLPTDGEWSFAVGIGHDERRTTGATPEMLKLNAKIKTEYPWGKKWPPPKGAGNYLDTTGHDAWPSFKVIEGYTDGYATTAPVMSFTPNKFGIYDLGGNVAEWADDWFNMDQKTKVLRGGSFRMEKADWLLSSHRFAAEPSTNLGAGPGGFGFRVVLETSNN